MSQEGLYEQLINKLVLSKLNDLDKNTFYIKETAIDKDEAARVLPQYLSDVIRVTMIKASLFSRLLTAMTTKRQYGYGKEAKQ